jgi:pSer/pThr/pTyr-binding forkhead associated (FHA) protein
VSRNQAEIFKSKGKWYIENYGTVTKTTLNGDVINRVTPLFDGDVIKIGDFAFLYEEK